jgi:ketosteroid isomerase-like protein
MTDFVAAEAAIRQLHARYTDAVWRKDYDAFGDCFTQDAEWRIGGMILRTRAGIVAQARQLFPRYRRILMNFRIPVLEVGEGTATGRTYVSEQSVFTDGRPYAPIGTYYERFVDEGDRWRFAWRLFQTQYSGPPDLSGHFFDNPDYGPPPAMPPLDAEAIDHTGALTKKG